MIHATAMPAEYIPPHVENAQMVDLSKLAVSSASSELIDRGDVLEMTLESGYEQEHINNTIPIRVAEDGSVQVPIVGRVSIAGMELTDAEGAIRTAAVDRGVFRNPNVTLVMKQQRMNKITVVGAVNEPGTYELPRASSALLAALVEAGGLSPEAGTDIEIRRPALRNEIVPGESRKDRVADGPHHLAAYEKPSATVRPASSVRINLISVTKPGSSPPSYYLDDGDVVMVEKRALQPITVSGLVHKPGQFKLPANQDLLLLEAIGLAGGTISPYCNKIHVIRHLPESDQPLVIRVSLREAKSTGKGNIRLGAGDIVQVEQTPANFAMDMLKTISPYAFSSSLSLLR